jgi:hypothetical protein
VITEWVLNELEKHNARTFSALEKTFKKILISLKNPKRRRPCHQESYPII